MKFIEIYLVVSLSLVSVALAKETVGGPCTNTPVFNITSFAVNPWPIYLNQQYTLSVTGTFLEGDYIEEIYIITKHLLNTYKTYDYQTVKKAFNANEEASFSITLDCPEGSIGYAVKVSFNRSDLKTLGCWEFTFAPTTEEEY